MKGAKLSWSDSGQVDAGGERCFIDEMGQVSVFSFHVSVMISRLKTEN
jgi:hypothetical protein